MVNKIKNIINIFIADDNILKPKGFIITLIREYLSENQREKAVLVAFYFLLLVYPVVVLSIFLIGKIPSLEVIDISNFLDAVNSPLLKDLYEHASLLSDSDLKFSLIIILLIFGSTAFQYIIDYSDFLFKVKKKRNYIMRVIISSLMMLVLSMTAILYNLLSIIVLSVKSILSETIITESIAKHISLWNSTIEIFSKYNFIYLLLIFLIILAFYKFITVAKLKFEEIIYGSVITFLFLTIGSKLLITYVASYSYYSKIYGNYLVFVVILMSSYVTSEVILFSLRINALVYRKNHLKKEQIKKSNDK